MIAGRRYGPPRFPAGHTRIVLPNNVRLIAHRGGVVDAQHRENSASALEAGVRQGYWMAEVDVRETADGRLLAHHDADFGRLFDCPMRVEETRWSEARRLRSVVDGDRPFLLREIVDLARDRIRLMIDIKIARPSQRFLRSLDSLLRENALLDTAYLIGSREACDPFVGGARVGIRSDALPVKQREGLQMADRYFVFQQAKTISREAVHFAQDLGVNVVPSVNDTHYSRSEVRQRLPGSDIERLLALGVTDLQVDSSFVTREC